MSLGQCKHRGIESIDLNQILVLVKAPIESVAQAFSQSRQADIWKRDVCECEVEFVGQGFIVFQFRGHPWTLVYEVNFVPRYIPLEKKDAQTLSRLLNTHAIYYQVSDTSGYIGYDFYENGTCMEMLYFEEGSSLQFQSQSRQLKTEDIGDAYSFTYDFMMEQDVYIPALQRVVIQQGTLRLKGSWLENLVCNDFERLDYIALK
jgi:hypothetical protein